jgi:hypothetical protein
MDRDFFDRHSTGTTLRSGSLTIGIEGSCGPLRRGFACGPGHVTNDRLCALAHRDVLNRDLLLPIVPVALDRLNLGVKVRSSWLNRQGVSITLIGAQERSHLLRYRDGNVEVIGRQHLGLAGFEPVAGPLGVALDSA